MIIFKDGIYYLIFTLLLFLNFIVLPNYILIISGLLLLFYIFIIFYEPKLTINPIQKIMLSPVNGKVYKIREEEMEGKKYTVLSFGLRPFKSHLNKIPLDGKVVYKKGYTDLKSSKFIKSKIAIESEFGTYLMEQTSYCIFKKLIFYPEINDAVYAGTTCGYSLLFSNLDLYIPDNFELLVNISSRLNAGEDIVARLKDL